MSGPVVDAAVSTRSDRAKTTLLELTRPECLRLLAATSIGRVVLNVSGWGHPVIRPVNYMFDPASNSVLIRSLTGSKLYALLHCASAAFEIDGTDDGAGTGWSVIITGVTEEITSPAEQQRIDGLDFESWAPGDQGCWIRMRANTVSGRRISAVVQPR